MVRLAVELDVPRLLELAVAYREESRSYKTLELDPSYAVHSTLLGISDPNQCLFVAVARNKVHGFFWGCVQPTVWCPSLIATDLMLYVEPASRGRLGVELIRAYAEWAKQVGAVEANLSSASGVNEERTFKLYERLGFSFGGSQYRKEL